MSPIIVYILIKHLMLPDSNRHLNEFDHIALRHQLPYQPIGSLQFNRGDSTQQIRTPIRSTGDKGNSGVRGGLLAWREGSAELMGSRDSTTLATTGLGRASPEEAEAPSQAWETTGGHFMSHTERSARAVSRYLATSPISAPASRRG